MEINVISVIVYLKKQYNIKIDFFNRNNIGGIKIKYGINVFNNLKGNYNILVFDTEEKAKENYHLLKKLWSDEEFCKDFYDIDFEIMYDLISSNCVAYIEDSNIDEQLDETGILEDFGYDVDDDIKILFRNNYVSIPS